MTLRGIRRLAVLAGLLGAVLLPGCAARTLRPPPPADTGAETRGEFDPRQVRDGDLLFRRGAGRVAWLDVSGLVAHIGSSPFSHVAVACWEAGNLWVYDARGAGVRKLPFEDWMRETDGGIFAVRRVRGAFRDRVPRALAYCETCYRRRAPYDRSFGAGEDGYYCSELVEKAYRSAGLPLSDPVPICRLPNYPEYPVLFFLVRHLTAIRDRGLVYAVGNEFYGLYGSPRLEPVYVSPEADRAERPRKAPLLEDG